MILHDAIVRLREVSTGAGCEDGDLRYAPLPAHHVCRYCRGRCLGVEYGGRVAEISSPEPFSARMLLEHLFDAPLKSEKTRAAAAGASVRCPAKVRENTSGGGRCTDYGGGFSDADP